MDQQCRINMKIIHLLARALRAKLTAWSLGNCVDLCVSPFTRVILAKGVESSTSPLSSSIKDGVNAISTDYEIPFVYSSNHKGLLDSQRLREGVISSSTMASGIWQKTEDTESTFSYRWNIPEDLGLSPFYINWASVVTLSLWGVVSMIQGIMSVWV